VGAGHVAVRVEMDVDDVWSGHLLATLRSRSWAMSAARWTPRAGGSSLAVCSRPVSPMRTPETPLKSAAA